MGRRSHSRALAVWANGQRVGRWVIPTSGAMELTYDPTWIESKEARPLSLSLPINFDGTPLQGDKVGFFFDNLLPDSERIRQRVRTRFQTRSGEAFDLLAAIGRDCVGAIQLLPEDDSPKDVFAITATPLNDAAIERALRGAVSSSSYSELDADDDEFRISIAGAQEKTAFTLHKRRWCRPHGSTPSTHIFKLALGLVGGRQLDMSHSLENEWLCSRLMSAYGVPTAPCEVKQFGTTKALVVERFDRKLHVSNKYWLRLPQEDFCQATGTPSSKKYEADGGPGLIEIARVLHGSERRQEDLQTLLKAQLLFWMLAATDGHAKNFSIRLLAQGRYQLTPLYDVMSAWPVIGNRHDQLHPKKIKLAMGLKATKKHYRIGDMQRRHFNLVAQRCGLGSDMEPIIAEVIESTPSVIEKVAEKLPETFPSKLFEQITTNLRDAAERMASMPST
jgi:serine/threonine-protein kinase HipA